MTALELAAALRTAADLLVHGELGPHAALMREAAEALDDGPEVPVVEYAMNTTGLSEAEIAEARRTGSWHTTEDAPVRKPRKTRKPR